MAAAAHLHKDKPIHFAVQHNIINNCNPDAAPIELPDGRAARLVVVDDRQPVKYEYGTADVMRWWPLAQSNSVADKLQRRIMGSGYVLPILTAIAGALLSEIYTTTSGAGSPQRRVRLRYRSSPIADFGICHGSARVVAEDRLLFYSMKTQKFIDGQDPDDHYWLYFTSLKGEEVFLDCAMFPFNFTQLIRTTGYFPPSPDMYGLIDLVPCFWSEREIRKHCVSLYTERDRVSVLRNEKLQNAMRHCSVHFTNEDLKTFYSFMASFSKKELTGMEKRLFKGCLELHCHKLGDVLDSQLWKTYPKFPQIALDLDPNETMDGVQWGMSF